MKSTSDILVIGGGVIGLSCAWALAQTGASVAIVDAQVKGAATPAAAGMLAPTFESQDANFSNTLADFGRRSLDAWRIFADALHEAGGVDIDLRFDGAMAVAFDETGAERLAAQVEGEARLITGDEARSLEPFLSPVITGALYSPIDGQVDPRRVKSALETVLAQYRHCHFEKGAVAQIETQSGRVTGVRLAGARLDRWSAPVVILAAGAAGAALAPPMIANNLFPVKGEALAVQDGQERLRRVIRTPDAYICPKAGGRTIIGATEIAHRDDANVDDGSIAVLRDAARRTAPHLAQCVEIERWAGARPGVRDGAPVIGDFSQGPGGLFMALGHYRNGILLAPETARAIADLVGGQAAPGLAAFSPDRFLSGTGANH